MRELRRYVLFTSATDDGFTFRWNGSLTINIYLDDMEIDVITLAEHDRAQEAAARSAIHEWLDNHEVNDA